MQPVFDIERYNERLDALFSRFQSVQKVGFTGDAYKPGLDGMRRLSALLGDPWKRYPCVHVAGTNGKGSVCSMLAAALAAGDSVLINADGQCADKAPLVGRCRALCPSRMASSVDGTARRVGLYTSPHLLDFRERMKIVSGDRFEMISREEVWEFLNKYEAELEGLSFFEVTTGMAFWWFAKKGVDAAVIETGLGGTLDSTNIITPVLSVVTSIGLDHCTLLGSTRSAIAWQKAGIFKPGVPAVVGVRDPETALVFEAAADAIGAPLVFASDIPALSISGASPAGTILSETELLAQMDLTGPCQNLNLHTVLVCLAVLDPAVSGLSRKTAKTSTGTSILPPTCKEKRPKPLQVPPFYPLPVEKNGQNLYRSWRTASEMAELSPETVLAIAKSAKRTGLWGRWQRVCEKPELICDIGHNPPALKENFARLVALQKGMGVQVVQGNDALHHGEERQPRQLIIVYGIMADKDLAGIAPMMPAGATYILTAPDSPRSMPAEELAVRLAELRPDIKTETVPSVADAVRRALDLAQDLPKPFIYIGGSTFVVAEALPLFNETTEP